jgi:anti-sigma B factor antagonist
MDISSSRPSPTTAVIAVSGEIDMATVGAIHRAVDSAITTAGTNEVVIDLAGVTFCDSSGIAAFDQRYANAAARGVRLRVAQPQPSVRRVLEIAGLMDALTAP